MCFTEEITRSKRSSSHPPVFLRTAEGFKQLIPERNPPLLLLTAQGTCPGELLELTPLREELSCCLPWGWTWQLQVSRALGMVWRAALQDPGNAGGRQLWVKLNVGSWLTQEFMVCFLDLLVTSKRFNSTPWFFSPDSTSLWDGLGCSTPNLAELLSEEIALFVF